MQRAEPIPAADPDPSLIELARRGDRRAIEAIVVAELPRIERLLSRLLGPRNDREDLVQTVYLETWRALPRFRGDSKLSTFIGGITVRVAKRAMRPAAWFRRRGELVDEPVSQDASPDRQTHAREQVRRVRSALADLSANKRIAFLLWALDGRSLEEVAELTGTSVSTARGRIYLAQKELKNRAAQDPYLAELLPGGEP